MVLLFGQKYQNYFWISALNFFVASWGLPWDLVCNIINKEAYRKPQKISGQKSRNNFVGIFVQTIIPKGHFEINWPLPLRNKTDATADGRKVNCCAMKILLAPQSREAFLFHLVLFYFCKVAFLLIYGICGMQAISTACHLLSNTGPSHSAHCCLVFVLVLFLVKMHYI